MLQVVFVFVFVHAADVGRVVAHGGSDEGLKHLCSRIVRLHNAGDTVVLRVDVDGPLACKVVGDKVQTHTVLDAVVALQGRGYGE